MNFITSQNVDSYHLDEDSWWVLDYTKNPHDLKNMIESLVIKEKQYQEYIQKLFLLNKNYVMVDCMWCEK